MCSTLAPVARPSPAGPLGPDASCGCSRDREGVKPSTALTADGRPLLPRPLLTPPPPSLNLAPTGHRTT